MPKNIRISLYSFILVIGIAIGIGKLIDIFKWCICFKFINIILYIIKLYIRFKEKITYLKIDMK